MRRFAQLQLADLHDDPGAIDQARRAGHPGDRADRSWGHAGGHGQAAQRHHHRQVKHDGRHIDRGALQGLLALASGHQGRDDEQQADQRPGRPAHQQIEVVPALEHAPLLCQASLARDRTTRETPVSCARPGATNRRLARRPVPR